MRKSTNNEALTHHAGVAGVCPSMYMSNSLHAKESVPPSLRPPNLRNGPSPLSPCSLVSTKLLRRFWPRPLAWPWPPDAGSYKALANKVLRKGLGILACTSKPVAVPCFFKNTAPKMYGWDQQFIPTCVIPALCLSLSDVPSTKSLIPKTSKPSQHIVEPFGPLKLQEEGLLWSGPFQADGDNATDDLRNLGGQESSILGDHLGKDSYYESEGLGATIWGLRFLI